jgi:5-methylcytosine-specific restriction endonuclease McrA
LKELGTSKTCGRCGETKPVSSFYRHRRTKDGLRWSCKTYEAQYWRTYYRKHTEMKRLYVERRRTRRKGAQGHHTLAEWRQLCEAYGHKCLYCGASGVPLTGDHVIPLSLGGSDSIANPQPFCVTCNSMTGGTIANYRGGNAVVDKNNLDRVTVEEAAERLGVKEQAIRKRISRGTLPHDKDKDGRVYVYIVAGVEDEVEGTDTRADTYLEALVESLQDQNRFLREELMRRDAILMNMTETMRQLTAPSSPEESPGVSETGTESAEGAGPGPNTRGTRTREGPFRNEDPERRGFWFRLFRG